MSVCFDESDLCWSIFLTVDLRSVQKWGEQQHDRLFGIEEGSYTHQSIAIVEQLLNDIEPSQNRQMVLYSSNVWACISGLVIPHPRDAGPDLAVPQVRFFNGRPIPRQVTKTFDPGLHKGRHRFHQQGRHTVRQINKSQHEL